MNPFLLFFFLTLVLSNNAGMKVTLTEASMTYILSQLVPYFEKQFVGMSFPEIKSKVSTPLGKVEVTCKNMVMKTLSLGDALMEIHEQNTLVFKSKAYSATAHGDWKYRECSFPHVEDHGSFDVKVAGEMDLKFVFVVDASSPTGFDLQCSAFQISFSTFDIKLHGGQSWLYDLFIKEIKGSIEKEFRKKAEDIVPKTISEDLDDQFSKIPFTHPIGQTGAIFDFKANEFKTVAGSYLVSSTFGRFEGKDIKIPFAPEELPDSTTTDKFVYLYLSQYSLNSGGYVFDKLGVLKKTITADMVPDFFPFKLNTSSFKDYIPLLSSLYPKQLMQLDVSTVNYPTIKITKAGIEALMDLNFNFFVVNGTNLVDVFEFEVNADLNATLGIKKLNDSSYVLNGDIDLKSQTIKLRKSWIGSFNPSTFIEYMKELMSDMIIPVMDSLLSDGFKFPELPFVTLVDPTLLFNNGFVEIRSNFKIVLP